LLFVAFTFLDFEYEIEDEEQDEVGGYSGDMKLRYRQYYHLFLQKY